ncbi:MAG: VRR-NUC domain-containing protein [Acidobacteria bacterium]|nr:VRR-NUC domain-containing protein [Acidobacteriota bacterium]
MQPESQLIRQIKAYLDTINAFHFKVHGSEYMMAGLPDIICCYRGYYIGIEAKMPGNKLSERQKYIKSKIEQAKGVYWVIYSKEELEEKFMSFVHST